MEAEHSPAIRDPAVCADISGRDCLTMAYMRSYRVGFRLGIIIILCCLRHPYYFFSTSEMIGVPFLMP